MMNKAKEEINDLKKGYFAFVLGSIIIYLIFAWNYYQNLGFTKFVQSFQEFGLYFVSLIILRHTVLFYINKTKKPFLNIVLKISKLNFLNLFIMIILSHILSAMHLITFVLDKLASKWNFINYGSNYNLIYVISGFLALFYTIILLKKKNNNDKKYLISAIAIITINLFYSGSYLFFLHHNLHIHNRIIHNIAKNNLWVTQCHHEIVCKNISIEDLEKEFKDLETKISEKDPDYVLMKNISLTQKNFIQTIKTSKDELVDFHSFEWKNIFSSNRSYAIEATYNKKTNYLVLDYRYCYEIFKIEDKKFSSIVGLSTMAWIVILLILIALHDIVLKKKQREASYD